jgi:hypothetical protein
VRALAVLARRCPDLDVELLVAGGVSGDGGSDAPHLARLAWGEGVGDRVRFLPPQPHDQLATLFRAADLVLVPSHSESYGLVALEAQACGTPVIAARVGGLVHAVGDGTTGLLGRRPRLGPHRLPAARRLRRPGRHDHAGARGAGVDELTDGEASAPFRFRVERVFTPTRKAQPVPEAAPGRQGVWLLGSFEPGSGPLRIGDELALHHPDGPARPVTVVSRGDGRKVDDQGRPGVLFAVAVTGVSADEVRPGMLLTTPGAVPEGPPC